MSPAGFGTKNDSAGEGQQPFTGLDSQWWTKWKNSEGSQSRETVKYDHEWRGIRNQGGGQQQFSSQSASGEKLYDSQSRETVKYCHEQWQVVVGREKSPLLAAAT
jgi:hypothetical protein